MASGSAKPRATRVTPAGAGALACLVLLVLTGFVALTGSRVRAADETVLRGFRSLDRGWGDGLLSAVAHLADPPLYLIATAVLLAVALRARRRPRLAVGVAVLLGGSAITTQLLKHALAQPRLVDWLGAFQVGNASWPSGHATAAMALALAAVLVAGRGRRRWAAIVGGAFAAAVGTAVLALAWHFPSDVLGGFLVAAVWALGVVAVLEVVDPAQRSVTWADARLAVAALITLLGLGLLASGVAFALRSAGALDSLAVPARLGGAAIVAMAAAALPLALSRAVDR